MTQNLKTRVKKWGNFLKKRGLRGTKSVWLTSGKTLTDYALRELQGRTSRRSGKEDTSTHCWKKNAFSDFTLNTIVKIERGLLGT